MNTKNANTETILPKNMHIDILSDDQALLLMLKNQAECLKIIKKNLSLIKIASNAIINHLNKHKDGRIIYVGAGTSGRIAVQDGAELYPTFSWPKKRFSFIIAGGKKALTSSIEGSEDNISEAYKNFIDKKINNKDVVIALAASGKTPFTFEILRLSKLSNALTIGIENNSGGLLQKIADYSILLNTGAEALAGSTRLKAGTSQKICLNLMSTLIMTRMGRVKKGLMSHMKPQNHKLKTRQKLIQKKLKN